MACVVAGDAWRCHISTSLLDRATYPTLTESIYLNQASLGLIGTPAVEAMHRFLDDTGRHGNLHMSDEDEVAFLDALRDRAAQLLRTEARRVGIFSSASELLGQVPFMLPPPPGAEVLAVATDFPAVTRPWLRLAQHGESRLGFVNDDPRSDLTSDLIARLDSNTSLVAVGSVQYATGTVIDVPRLRAATAEAGVNLVVDATQAAGALATDTGAWHADIVVSSGYKWLGGHGGVAIGAIAPAILANPPPLPGWMGAPDPFAFDATRLLLANDARRYTQSTMSYVSIAGLTAAIDQLLAKGLEKVELHAERLAHMLIGAVEPLGWCPFRPLDDEAASSHIVSLKRGSDALAPTRDRLRAKGIVCSTRGGRLRVSLAPYNDDDDVAVLVDALA